ncbi:MAG: DUF1614 domain-containing protein [Methanomicrobiales archaeon]|nr:DUF1614 domain-containing protein [Methanomicrobiales archaeon]
MQHRYLFNPFTFVMLLLLVGVFLLVVPLLILSLIGTTFAKLGFSWREVLLILGVTLVGSFVNIPLTTIQGHPIVIQTRYDHFFGMFYRIPVSTPTTTIAVNVGGAVLPLLISAYLLFQSVAMTGRTLVLSFSLLGMLVVAGVTKMTSRPVRGLGIMTPFFIPPLTALLCGLALSALAGSPEMGAPIIAYASGTLGTILGADLLNLHRIRELGAPLVSIGGAGTFDGVFLSGLIAAFLA